MKKTVFAIALPLFVTWSGVCFSDTCYTVEGKVKTINVSETMQIGSIDLQLFDEYDDEAFRETGELTGTITGGNGLATYLTHFASFGDGSTFVTSEDKAVVTEPYVRRLAEDGTPCSLFIAETITDMQGSGFLANVSKVEIHADGYISACIADGENENEFKLTGDLCIGE